MELAYLCRMRMSEVLDLTDANELDNDLNDNPNLAIFRQTDNGVLVRMALFASILGVSKEIDNYARPISWKNVRKN